MLRCAIVEDSPRELEHLKECLARYSAERDIPLETTAFGDAASFLEHYRADYDIVFMDIELPGINGMEAAHQLRRQEIEQLSSLSISSFDTMELRYYPNTMDAQNGVNVRAYMGRLLDGLKQYAEDFSPTENESLMLIGNAGLGKTHAALAIAGLVLEQGHDVIYVSSPDFFGKIEASRFDPSGDADTLLRTASTADLLILDDLGNFIIS